jgi:N-acetyl-anhydromuramyl-L-alanine amidase AmpD
MSFETDNWEYRPARLQIHWDKPRPVRLIVVHATESPELATGAENNARWFQNPQAGGSAHVVVDSDSVIQCVKDNDQAAGANGVNRDGIHVELVGYAKQTSAEWMDKFGLLMLERGAGVVAQYALKYDIPAVHLTNDQLLAGAKGIIGHYQATACYKPNHGHEDPGPSFPWTWFMQRVVAQVAHYQSLRQSDVQV